MLIFLNVCAQGIKTSHKQHVTSSLNCYIVCTYLHNHILMENDRRSV